MAAEFTKKLSVALSVLLLVAYALGLLFSLKTTASCSPARNMANQEKRCRLLESRWACWQWSRCVWRW